MFSNIDRATTPASVAMTPLIAVGFLFAYLLSYSVYQLVFSPLRNFPGPKLWAISYIPYVRLYTSGNGHREILALHQKYGPIVRVGPTHLSINHPDGMQDVRGHRKTGENPKDAINAIPNRDNIIGANREDHQRFRRLLAHGFSAQTMLAQQPVIRKYVDQLFEKLHDASEGGTRPVDIERWFNFTTFDVIGDLAFGEPFGCPILVVAGSETTATLLSAATFFLATNPASLAKINEEVRSTFQSEDQIDMLSVQNLKYLSAVLDESLRLYPPVPSSSPRMIGEGGDKIIGEFIPEGTTMDVWQWAVYHNPDHFAMAEEFIPERWLDDPRFAGDAKRALQPFSIGPRNCIGKNLAYAEMRLILARLIWNFDLRATENLQEWYDDSEVYILWQKVPVNVYLMPRT